MSAELGIYVAIGFLAQIVDGALGMAFGVIGSSSLMAMGVPPALASASVHAAEIVTTGISGASHVWHRNVDWTLFRRLAGAGLVGGILGAYVLTGLPAEIVRPIVVVYLAAMAVLICARVAGHLRRRWNVPPEVVGSGGAFLDAIGGGGWGPLVASTLIASGDKPRRTIGTTNTTEFVVTIAISATFLTQLDLSRYGQVVIGLIVGGAIAAPLAGWLVRRMPHRTALALVALVISGLTAFNLYTLVR
ncbi:MAG: sulfite exporter TauE/SafE family protein [Alphaproteobacteria bacterium]